MKRLPSMSLVVALGATVGACDADPGAQVTQRDVYTGAHALENCIADWGNQDLCKQQLSKDDAHRVASANRSGGGSHPVFLFMNGGTPSYGYYGPSYAPGNRSATYNGQACCRSRRCDVWYWHGGG